MNNKWIIYSIEHNRFWKTGESGYTFTRAEAGIYSFEEALRITLSANRCCKEDQLHEAMIPINED